MVSGGVAVVVQQNDYNPFGMLHYPQSVNNDNQYLYNGKEFQGDIDMDWYDYGARMYDPSLGRWHVIDAMYDRHYDFSPYAYVLNNPMLLIDPNGLTDYKYDKETGEVTQVGEANDEPDRIVKTKQFGKHKGEVKTHKHGKKEGQNKAVSGLDNIEKGILSDGMNFKSDDNIIQVGGEGQPKLESVEEFLVKFSDHIDKEIAVGYLSGENQTERGDVSAVYIDEYEGNSDTHATFNLKVSYIGTAKIYTLAHTHLSRMRTKYDPSDTDRKTKESQEQAGVRTFLILSDHPKGPLKY